MNDKKNLIEFLINIGKLKRKKKKRVDCFTQHKKFRKYCRSYFPRCNPSLDFGSRKKT